MDRNYRVVDDRGMRESCLNSNGERRNSHQKRSDCSLAAQIDCATLLASLTRLWVANANSIQRRKNEEYRLVQNTDLAKVAVDPSSLEHRYNHAVSKRYAMVSR